MVFTQKLRQRLQPVFQIGLGACAVGDIVAGRRFGQQRARDVPGMCVHELSKLFLRRVRGLRPPESIDEVRAADEA